MLGSLNILLEKEKTKSAVTLETFEGFWQHLRTVRGHTKVISEPCRIVSGLPQNYYGRASIDVCSLLRQCSSLVTATQLLHRCVARNRIATRYTDHSCSVFGHLLTDVRIPSIRISEQSLLFHVLPVRKLSLSEHEPCRCSFFGEVNKNFRQVPQVQPHALRQAFPRHDTLLR